MAKKSIKELIKLWDELNTIPLENSNITKEFMHFGIGSNFQELRDWLISLNRNFSVSQLQNGFVVHCVAYESKGSGGFDWYYLADEADAAFASLEYPVKEFAHENYIGYRFDAIVSSKATASKEIASYLDELISSPDKTLVGRMVQLQYFKASGKFYAEGSYISIKEHMFEIYAEVTVMQVEGKLPDLVEGANGFTVLINLHKDDKAYDKINVPALLPI